MSEAMNYDTIQEVQARIWKVFLSEKRNLDATEAAKAVQVFETIDNATITDLNSLRRTLTSYVENCSTLELGLANAANNVLITAENEYFFERLGYMTLTSSARQESFDGGLTYVTTVTSMIGPGSISNVSAFDDDSLTGVLGNNRLAPITLLGVTYDTPKSITDAINKLVQAAETAIGQEALNIAGSITLNQCSLGPNVLGAEIYTLPADASEVQAFNGIIACSAWVVNSETYGITNTDNADDCYIFPVEKALAGCIYYLSGQQMS